MKCKNVKKEFTMKKLKLDDDQTDRFVLTMWQDTEQVDVLYVIYRVIFCLTFLLAFYLDMRSREGVTRCKYFIYLTNWSFLAYTAYSVVAMFAVAEAYAGQDPSGIPQHKRLYLVVWVLGNVATDMAVFVTLSYWTYLTPWMYRGFGVVEQNRHVWNVVLMMMDFSVNTLPVRVLHYYGTISFGLAYLVFNFLYCTLGGTNDYGEPYVYAAVDWRQPLQVALKIVAIVILSMMIRWFTFFLYCCKRAIKCSIDKIE